MFAANYPWAQLAFGGVLNGVYSVALLLVLVWAWRGHSKLREGQRQWFAQWEAIADLCHKQLDELKEVESAEVLDWMRSGWMTDLAARLDASMGFPAPEETSSEMLHCATHGKPFLFAQPELARPWEKLPGVAILLGLLGTFIGLTFALTQLPFRGDLKQLTGGLQQVLPLMGTAFWTSVCGLVASLLLRFVHSTAVGFQQMRSDAYERLHGELSRRSLREIFPHLTRAGLGSQAGTSQQAVVEGRLELDLAEQLEAAFSPLQEQLKSHAEALHAFPQQMKDMAESLSDTSEVLKDWREQLGEANASFADFARRAGEAVEPIAHAERLLSERISALTRQHERITEQIEALSRRERDLPEKLREILKLSLRPAHQSLQRTSRGLQSSLELVFERDRQERESARRLFQDLGERFSAIDRLTQSFEKSTREIAQISDALVDLSNRLRFRIPDDEPPAEDSNDRVLDAEIEQLLEGFDLEPPPAEPTSGE